jgi:MoaA/NifB/PqqE/SkfB family radical SAM enzyme
MFCPHATMRRPQGTMSSEIFARVIEQCVKNKIRTIVLTGFGEPLLDGEYVARIQYAKDQGIPVVSCVTNGIMLSEDMAEKLFQAGLDYLSVSIDAATQKTYDTIHHRGSSADCDGRIFSQVERNIEAVIRMKENRRARKPFFEVRFKDFDSNRPDLKQFIAKYKNRVDALTIYMNIFNWPGSDIPHNLPAGRNLRFPCYNLWSTVYVTFDGRFVLCCQDYEGRQELGDIRHGDITTVWHSEKLAGIRAKHLTGNFGTLPLCKDCVINTHYVTPWW